MYSFQLLLLLSMGAMMIACLFIILLLLDIMGVI